jgi:hypothetical protein
MTAMTTNRNKEGRRPVITEKVRQRVVELSALGVPFYRICQAIRVSKSALHEYRQTHPDFEEQVQQSIALAIERNLEVIRRAADTGDVRAATWYLERVHPSDFCRNRLEISGTDGQPLAQIAIVLPAKNLPDGGPAPAALPIEPPKELSNGV